MPASFERSNSSCPLPTPGHGEILAKEIPEARFEVIPDVGHFTNLEEPDAVNGLLAQQFAHDCQH